jgi:succinate dehydrogenase / fumarate reductase, membrane anchor subunit
MRDTQLRTALGRVEGLGSARAGTAHFWQQRLTAVALVPLSIWFVASALAYVGAEQGAVAAFFAEPADAILMFLFIVATVHHMSLGLQVVIEDYVHQEGAKVTLLVLNRFACWAIGAAAGYALVKMALGGPS